MARIVCLLDLSHYELSTSKLRLQGPHEVAGQAFLTLPSKRIKISKNVITYL